MSVTLPVEVRSGNLERVSTDVLVTPFFATDRPLRGPAARADWRMCGLLSQRLVEGRVTGALCEAVLMPAGRTLRAGAWLAVGLGPRGGFSERTLARAAQAAFSGLLGLRAPSAAFALPPEGLSGVTADRAAAAVLDGCVAGLRAEPRALQLLLLVPEVEAGRARACLAERTGPRGPGDVQVRLVRSTGPPAPREPGTAAPPGDAGVRSAFPSRRPQSP